MASGNTSSTKLTKKPSKQRRLADSNNHKNEILPADSANIFSKLSFWYASPILAISQKRPLRNDDLYKVPTPEAAKNTGSALLRNWEHQKAHAKNPSLFRAVVASFYPILLLTMLFKILWSGIVVFVPIFLVQRLVLFVQDANPTHPNDGWIYACMFFVASLLQSIFLHQVFWLSMRAGVRLRSSLGMAVYQKALRLKTAGNIGEIVNLVSNDCQRIQEAGLYFNFVWSTPVETAIVGGLLIWRIGWPGAVGTVVAGILGLWQIQAGNLVRIFRGRAIKLTDDRVRLMSEILAAVKLVKFYAWEVPFAKRVAEVRGVEVPQIRNNAYVRSFNFITMFCGPIFTTLVVFACYVGAGNTLDAQTAFVTLALINALRFSFNMMPPGVKALAEGKVGLIRIQSFLEREELPIRQPYIPLGTDDASENPIVIEKGCFSWAGEANQLTLSNINLHVPRGKLVAVIGPVGSGKSSLLSAVLEQIYRVEGDVQIRGGIGYVTQQAWIQNLTLRDNILFGAPFDEEKYNRTVKACALEPDLKQLAAGDQTEIGERGINLSGGQKQRVSIARAVYAEQDIILLDDPLSAVDQHVGKHLFDKCIRGILKGKTILLVTHQLQYLPHCDHILVMEEGKISAQGTFQELMEDKSKVFAQLISTHVDVLLSPEASPASISTEDVKIVEDVHIEKQEEKSVDTEKQPDVVNTGNTVNANLPPSEGQGSGVKKGQLTSKEENKGGKLAQGTVSSYIKYGGSVRFILVLILHVISQGANVLAFWWITYWVANPTTPDLNIGIYALLVGSTFVFCMARETLYQTFTLMASTNMHNHMFRTIMRAPMWFFDVTPLGRILNRFSQDMDLMDYMFPDISMQALHYTFQILGILALISGVLYYMPIILVPLAILFYFTQKYFSNSNRDIKRLDGAAKSPLFQHISATLAGLSVLRAFRQEPRFTLLAEEKIDNSVTATLQQYLVQRWLGFRLDFITVCVTFATAMLCVGLKGVITGAQAGLTITYSLQMAGTFQWTVRTIADSEAQLTSVERILEYCNPDVLNDIYDTPISKKGLKTSMKFKPKKQSANTERYLKLEPPPLVPDNRPGDEWPTEGCVKFTNVTVEYSKGIPVLHEINFETMPSEKIGVVGRTGAGKSTLALALFRMMEVCEGGSIEIDGLNIATIGTQDLRSKLAIIPQDPVLFEGTIRSNLDPFGVYDDEAIWHTLQQVHLAPVIRGLNDQLQAPVEPNGENFSVGQRQLMCIGRALLKRSKVLVLDEATAAVDLETDSIIQDAIRSNFQDCTIITIAHRLNTIIDCDRVLVMDKGKIAEFNHPAILLRTEGSIFKDMVEQMGPAATSRLVTIAEETYAKKSGAVGANKV